MNLFQWYGQRGGEGQHRNSNRQGMRTEPGQNFRGELKVTTGQISHNDLFTLSDFDYDGIQNGLYYVEPILISIPKWVP